MAVRVAAAAAALLAAVGSSDITRAEPATASASPAPPPGGARRIVSLAPSVTETVFALGEEARLVAVSDFCDYPPAAQRLPRAGSYLTPSVETIVALRPDAVVGVPTPGNRPSVERLRALGVNVVLVGETTIADAFDAMRTVGRWVDREADAEALVARLERELAEVRERTAARPRRRVLFVVGHDPLVVAGSGLFIDELIDVAGGRNVAAGGSQRWPRLSLETVVAEAPDVIVDGAMGSEGGAALTAWWEPYRSVPAVREGRLRAQHSDALLRPGPRLAEAARQLEALVWQDSSPPATAGAAR
ncbi:MAG TPA: cobalamin-binding protein [Candidatus Binatia bacterium]|nr:cobalamin-binding protein [Candidatus Binatia bacterium]